MTLTNAVSTAIAHGNCLADINAMRWALTYCCSSEDVKAEWERQEWERTQQPSNTCEVPDGK
jgi:hypothetical protein